MRIKDGSFQERALGSLTLTAKGKDTLKLFSIKKNYIQLYGVVFLPEYASVV